MSADLLRRAAALMRERASVHILGESPWRMATEPWAQGVGVTDVRGESVAVAVGDYAAEHIASWHPAVAFAVADLLDHEAEIAERPDFYKLPYKRFLDVARTYLGEDT